jgi:hypothetical protein
VATKKAYRPSANTPLFESGPLNLLSGRTETSLGGAKAKVIEPPVSICKPGQLLRYPLEGGWVPNPVSRKSKSFFLLLALLFLIPSLHLLPPSFPFPSICLSPYLLFNLFIPRIIILQ